MAWDHKRDGAGERMQGKENPGRFLTPCPEHTFVSIEHSQKVLKKKENIFKLSEALVVFE